MAVSEISEIQSLTVPVLRKMRQLGREGYRLGEAIPPTFSTRTMHQAMRAGVDVDALKNAYVSGWIEAATDG